MTHLPLVTAIMVTRGRPKWASEAVKMFEVQTYPNKELSIIDESGSRSFPGLNLWTARDGLTIGAKRNIAIATSTGEIIIHWDDDDIYSPDRIQHQVDFLLSRAVDMVGYHEMEFIDEENQKRYLYRASPNYAIGVSQCYWREIWEARKFEDKNEGEDNAFWMGRSVACCPADGRIVARIHGGNTSEKRGPAKDNPAQWVELPWKVAA